MFLRNLLLIIGTLAIVVGVVIAGFLWLRPGGGAHPSRPVAARRVIVMVAARPVLADQLLRDEDLSWRELDPGTPPPGSLTRGQASRSDFIGAVARRDLAQGEVITDSALIKKSDQRFLAAVLSPGHRAVTIDVDAAQSASGLILPNDRVDAILVQQGGDSAGQGANASHRSVAVLLLQDIRVIAVDRLIDRPATPSVAAGGKPAGDAAAQAGASPPKTMTLEVTERDAQRLLLATQLGKVDLSLRALARDREPVIGAAWGLDSAVWASDVSPLRSAVTPAMVSGPLLAQTPPGLAVAAPVRQRLGPRDLAPIRILRGSKVEAP